MGQISLPHPEQPPPTLAFCMAAEAADDGDGDGDGPDIDVGTSGGGGACPTCPPADDPVAAVAAAALRWK